MRFIVVVVCALQISSCSTTTPEQHAKSDKKECEVVYNATKGERIQTCLNLLEQKRKSEKRARIAAGLSAASSSFESFGPAATD